MVGRDDVLVPTQWVADHLNDLKVTLIEVDVDTTAYDEGHIPGAVGFNWTSQLQDQVRRDIATKEQIQELLSNAGVSTDGTIVLYGDNNNWFAAYAFWLLKYYGVENVKLMNGGRKKWVDEGWPVTTDAPTHSKTSFKVKSPNARIRALRDEVLQCLDKVREGAAALVDVRSPREYSGELLTPENLPQEGSQRGGHIPGAKNIVWSQAVNEDGTFKSDEQLKALYGGQGVTPDKDVIAYCRIGERSAHTWFVLTHLLGYRNVRNYDGSWTEWGSLVGAPIEKGFLTQPADLQVRSGGTPTAEPEAFPAPPASPPPPSTHAYTVWYGTNRRMISREHPARGFSSEREQDPRTIHYGTCEVSIPKSHMFGSLGSPWYRRWATLRDDRLKLREIHSASELDFWRLIKSELESWEESERQALVYVHGYSCSFEAAALRAAQIGFDLKATGVTAFFSWPSKGRAKDYAADEATIESCEFAISEFLVKLVSDVGAERVHVIAHSMGNRGLLRVMQRIQADVENRSAVKFGQIFLAAPDVDTQVFCQLAIVYPQMTRRTTLYVSPGDKAVGLSKRLHGASRAGFTPPVTCVPGVDTVEIPDFDLDMLGHSYYAKADGVLSDMFTLLRHDSPPDKRQRLQEAKRDDGTSYWTMGR